MTVTGYKDLSDDEGQFAFDSIKVDGKRNPERRKAVESGFNLQLSSDVATDFKAFRKTSVTYATQIPVMFFVDTIEGPQQVGQPGDFLVIGAAGEMYPVAMDIFLNTYELAND